MPVQKRIVFMVEGQGDVDAVPIIGSRVFEALNAWEHAIIDSNCMRIRSLGALLTNNASEWLRYLGVAAKRPNLGGVLLLLDGDTKRIHGEEFCAAEFARRLAELARRAGAGSKFSVACVFARQEFESWIIAAATQIAGMSRSDGLPGLPTGTTAPEHDLEEQPRNAKGWLNERMPNGYSETQDQAPLTRLMHEHIEIVADRMRSFRRFQKAIAELVDSIRNDRPTISPVRPEPHGSEG